jgi:hypothetical protein
MLAMCYGKQQLKILHFGGAAAKMFIFLPGGMMFEKKWLRSFLPRISRITRIN